MLWSTAGWLVIWRLPDLFLRFRSAMIGSAPRQRAIAVAAGPPMPAPPVIRIVSPGVSSPSLITVCQAERYGRPTAAASAIVRRSGLRDRHVSGKVTQRARLPRRDQ